MSAMKGLLFTEFLDYATATHGPDMVDDVIADCRLPNRGAYTSVGNYDHREMQALVAALAQRTGDGAPDILERFGRHLCWRFAELYPAFFSSKTFLFDFLESVHDNIHVEVKKLYPDAEFPSFRTHARNGSRLELDYRSCRPLAALAEGLIHGAADHFREPVEILQTRHEHADGAFIRFIIRLRR
jgi:hypothetical protein